MSQDQNKYQFGFFTDGRIMTTLTVYAWNVKQAIEKVHKLTGDDDKNVRFKLLKHDVSVQQLQGARWKFTRNQTDTNNFRRALNYGRRLRMLDYGRALIGATSS